MLHPQPSSLSQSPPLRELNRVEIFYIDFSFQGEDLIGIYVYLAASAERQRCRQLGSNGVAAVGPLDKLVKRSTHFNAAAHAIASASHCLLSRMWD
jgi:hypothetical protein